MIVLPLAGLLKMYCTAFAFSMSAVGVWLPLSVVAALLLTILGCGWSLRDLDSLNVASEEPSEQLGLP